MAVEDALFYSPHAAMQVICSNTRYVRHPVTGDIIETVPGVWARFGKQGQEYEFRNPETGTIEKSADIVGHYFDLREEASANGWDDDTAAMVARKLRGVARKQPEYIQEIPRVVQKAALPWPTYDALDAAQVVEFAKAAGLEAAALAYERENQGRPTVLDGLASDPLVDATLEVHALAVAEAAEEAKAVAEAAVPAELVAAAKGSSRTISV